MTRLPRVTPKQVEKVVLKLGFVYRGAGGSHRKYKRASDRRTVTVPYHSGKTLPLPTIQSILKQAGLTVEEFIRLL